MVFSLRLITDSQQTAVRRIAMIVIATGCKPGVDDPRVSAGGGDALDVAVAVEQESGSVARPVRCFEAFWRNVDHAAVGRRNRNRLQRAIEHGLFP